MLNTPSRDYVCYLLITFIYATSIHLPQILRPFHTPNTGKLLPPKRTTVLFFAFVLVIIQVVGLVMLLSYYLHEEGQLKGGFTIKRNPK